MASGRSHLVGRDAQVVSRRPPRRRGQDRLHDQVRSSVGCGERASAATSAVQFVSRPRGALMVVQKLVAMFVKRE
jgi:hypothetical protein